MDATAGTGAAEESAGRAEGPGEAAEAGEASAPPQAGAAVAVAEPAAPPVPAAGPPPAAPPRASFPFSRAVMVFLVFASFFFRVLWLDKPPGSLIFDERYYISAARTILHLPQPSDAPYAQSTAGKDPNQEHPALAKLIISYGMLELGDNAWGWRWMSVLAGTLCIPFLYLLARRAGLAEWAAILAAFLFSFDNLVFVTSRIGILDIFMLLGMLAGAYFFLAKRPLPAAVAFAFGTLCKEYGVYGPAIMAVFLLFLTLYQRPARAEVARRAARTVGMGALYLALFFAGLGALDRQWSTYTNPLSHVQSIWSYGTKLTHPAGPTGIESWPWEWLINEVQIPYLKVTVTICNVDLHGAPCPQDQIKREYASVLFRGAMNPYLIAGLPLALAYVLSRLRAADNRAALLSLVWFGLAYLPFIPAAVIDRRISYLYYMLPVIPAIVLASAALFSDRRIPRAVTWGYIVGVLYGFAGYFPFTGFRI